MKKTLLILAQAISSFPFSITNDEVAGDNTPTIAVITPSTTTGKATLTVTFDSSDSSNSNSAISSDPSNLDDAFQG